jgi:hypothetical protein
MLEMTKAGIYSRQLKSNLGKLYSSPEFNDYNTDLDLSKAQLTFTSLAEIIFG